ncbi:hypothetical protein OHB49_36015 [Streptomyces sp. NBC_01717]|uniref:hypothetical protein n=1 Tax=Streptomyces sp. NBC_01717 TaxID=2975918 RepID=UPI002E305937|nr:hypothetical protein [Streptomyces sp. NBC_01717]
MSWSVAPGGRWPIHVTDADGRLWTLLPLGALHGYGIALLERRLAAPGRRPGCPEILAAVST